MLLISFNNSYKKFELSSDNDVNFGFENITSESEFLLSYKNTVHTQILLWRQEKILALENNNKIPLYNDKLCRFLKKGVKSV